MILDAHCSDSVHRHRYRVLGKVGEGVTFHLIDYGSFLCTFNNLHGVLLWLLLFFIISIFSRNSTWIGYNENEQYSYRHRTRLNLQYYFKKTTHT